MKRIASGSQVAALPTHPAGTGTAGYFADAATTPSATPTSLTPEWFNAVQEAIVRTIEDGGGTPATDFDLFKTTVAGVHGIKAHATDTGVTSAVKRRVVVGALNSRASAAESGVFGGSGNLASATGAATFGGDTNAATAVRAACVGGTGAVASAADAVTVGGDSALASAAKAGTFAGDNPTASGLKAVAIGGLNLTASGEDSACVGGLNSTSSGAASACVGGTGVASGAASACVGGQGTASASYAATLGGLGNTSSGRSAAVTGGESVTVSGDYSGAVAAYGSSCAGEKSALLSTNDCVMTSAADQSVLLGAKSCELIAPNVVAGGYSAGALTPAGANQNLTWRINSTAGTMILLSTLTQSGAPNADYAEMFPNATGEEIPPGTLLARVGRAVKPAWPGDRVCGVVSAAPAILTGGTGELAWANRDMTDEWGRIVYDHVDVLDAEGNVRYTLKVPRPSPHYDPTRVNVPRTERPSEWVAVALVGQVRVRIGPDVEEGDYLTPGADGCAVGTLARPDGRPVEVMEITTPYDPAKGYGVALCLVG